MGMSAQEIALPQISGLAAWYRGDKGITIATGVSQWTDLSGGTGRNLTQATGALQPAYIVNAINGQPALRFSTAGTQNLATAAFTLNQAEAVWIVAKSITYGTAGVKDIWMDGNTAGSMVIGSVISGGYSISGGSAITYAASVANGVYAYIGNVYNGASSAIRVNGVQQATGNAGASNAGGITLGALANGTRGSNFECAELIVFSKSPAAGEIVAIEAYLKARYAL